MKHMASMFIAISVSILIWGCATHHDHGTQESSATPQSPSRESYLGHDEDPYNSGAVGLGAAEETKETETK